MAAAPEARSWADLPAACLREVFCRVPCLADRLSAFRACPRWLAALRPPALPSLLLPAPNPMGSPRLVCVHDDHRHHCRHPIPHGARCFGCHEGGWLFLGIRDPLGYTLFNIHTGAVLDLPRDMEMHLSIPIKEALRMIGIDLPSDMEMDLPPPIRITSPFPMITVHGVALSAAPDDEMCVAMCIVTTAMPPRARSRCVNPKSVSVWPRCVARWRVGMGQQLAFEIRPPGGPDFYNFVDAEDLVYHDGSFHLLLSSSADIWVCTPQLLLIDMEEWEKRSFVFHFHPGRRTYDDGHRVRGRYLVSSRGQLLLVVRFDFEPRGHLGEHTSGSTSKFKVFQAIERPHQVPEVDPRFPVAEYPWAWSQLDSLDGRILFVGCGCSRSYELNDAQGRIQYKGFKADIYFLDDHEFYYVDAEQYLCSDNGRWSETDGVQHCFPRAHPSWISPPAWLLP